MNVKHVFLFVMVILVAFAFLPVSVFAQNPQSVKGWGPKLERGLLNAATGFVELAAQTHKGAKRGFKGIEYEPVSHPLGALAGSVEGVHHTAGRTLSGVFDTAGFWAAGYRSNEDYVLPLDAEYAWQEGTSYSIFEPDLAKGLSPAGHKALRGASDLTFSWLKFPGEIIRESKAGNPGLGLTKGTYVNLSRLYSGASDVSTFLFPGPKDSVGKELE